jgi:hypothetical protein
LHGNQRFELWLADHLKKFGPFVAIGAPKDELPELGAYRTYVPDDEWQRHALSLMDRAHVILLIPSTSPSVAWELAEIVRRGHLRKTAFLFPSGFSSAEREERFRAASQPLEAEYEIAPFELADMAIVHFFDPRCVTTIKYGGFPDEVAIQMMYAERFVAR